MQDPHTPQSIEHWTLDRLAAYPRNARQHGAQQISQIAASIATYGFNDPIEVLPNGTVVSGHGRLEAARQLGLETVPVVILSHLTDAQHKAYTLAANRLAETATWDNGLLASELDALRVTGEVDVEALGFSDSELRSLELSLQADLARMEAGEGGESSAARPSFGTPVVSYQVVFDDIAQQKAFHGHLRALRSTYPELPTHAARLVAWMERHHPKPPETL